MENYLKNNQSYIYNAILKYGHSNFSLTIIEYCEPEKCLERENYYLSYLEENNKYNIAKKSSAPMSGRKHYDETKKQISDAMTGFKHSDETKKIISDAQKGKTLAFGVMKLKNKSRMLL